MDRGDGTSEPLYVRVICEVKADETMGLVPNLQFIRVNTKSSKFFLMLKLAYTKSGVTLLQTGPLVCPTRMGGPS